MIFRARWSRFRRVWCDRPNSPASSDVPCTGPPARPFPRSWSVPCPARFHELLLWSQRCVSPALVRAGYRWERPDLREALERINAT